MALRLMPTPARWNAGDIGRIDRDLRACLANPMGIHRALRYLISDPARGFARIRKPNAAFEERSALGVTLRDEITDLSDLRTYSRRRARCMVRPPIRHSVWPRSVRIIRTIHPPVDLYADIADPSDGTRR